MVSSVTLIPVRKTSIMSYITEVEVWSVLWRWRWYWLFLADTTKFTNTRTADYERANTWSEKARCSLEDETSIAS